MNDFSQFLYNRRKALGLTQQNIADQLNITNKAVSKWESGECFPETAQLVALADILECTVDELLRGRFAEKETAIAVDENAPQNTPESSQNTDVPCALKPWKIGISTGIGLLAFGILAFFLFIIAFGNTDAVAVWAIGILLFFIIAAVIAFIFAVVSYAVSDTSEKSENPTETSDCDHMEKKNISGLVGGIIMMLATIIFLLCGFLWDKWHPAWVVFPIGGILCGIVELLLKAFTK